MFRSCLYLGIASGVLSAAGAVGYAAYYNKMVNDYTYILSYASIISACVFVCIFACIMFWAARTSLKNTGEIVFNFLFTSGSMASIYYPLTSTFENDGFGYFMVYAIPLHFFPVLSWFALQRVFFSK